MKTFVASVSAVALGVAVIGLTVVGPADAGRPLTVRCVGTADFCGASISIAGGKQTRVVTIDLSGTNLKLVSMTAIPAASRRSFLISQSSYRRGGSQFRFTLNSVRSNPRGARVVLSFAAGGRAGKLNGVGQGVRGTENATATFSVGAGKTVSIVGGGETSYCTRDETNTTFVTKGNDEPHTFGFYAKSDGWCFVDDSWSDFKVTVKDSAGKQIGAGTMMFRQVAYTGYVALCVKFSGYVYDWKGLVCEHKGTGQRGVKIHL